MCGLDGNLDKKIAAPIKRVRGFLNNLLALLFLISNLRDNNDITTSY
jgi:hypothetical protein